MKFKAKQLNRVTVEAICFDGLNLEAVGGFIGRDHISTDHGCVMIGDQHTPFSVPSGYWIVKLPGGHLRAYPPDVFTLMFESAV